MTQTVPMTMGQQFGPGGVFDRRPCRSIAPLFCCLFALPNVERCPIPAPRVAQDQKRHQHEADIQDLKRDGE